MSALPDDLVVVGRAAEMARLVAAANDRLARTKTISPDVARLVRGVAADVTGTDLERWRAVDPYLALLAHRSTIQALTALDDRAKGRDALRLALEGLRQALAAIAEGELVGDERSPKQVAQWLAATAEVPQTRLARLLDVSYRQFQRWISTGSASAPDAEEARRVRAVARIFNQLHHVLTPTGAIDWFTWPRSDLGGSTPQALLGDPARLPDLLLAAGSLRSTYAS